MSRKCQITSKRLQRGCKISHAHNKSLRTWQPNLVKRRLFDSETGQWVRLKVSTRVLRTIDKLGLAAALRKHGLDINRL